jgi:hypothetical protein
VLPDEELASLRSRFAWFADEARGSSPLYAHLSHAISEDIEVASVLAAAPRRQRRPNLLFAAVHDVLLSGVAHRLAAYYPSVGGDRPPDEGTMPAFRDFLDELGDEVVGRVSSRSTQTNEPGRCGALRPALARLAACIGRPVALVELGASAGLLLHLDRYLCRYGEVEVGPRTSPVTIEPALRGPAPADLDLPPIQARIGIDLRPLSPDDPCDARWVRACVWPEDVGRMARLDAALAVASEHDDVELVEGNFVTAFVPVVRSVAPDAVVCVMHSTALAYVGEQARSSIEDDLDHIGAERDLARICFEGAFVEPFATMERELGVDAPDEVGCLLGLTVWLGGRREDELLARAHPHGTWVEWLGP